MGHPAAHQTAYHTAAAAAAAAASVTQAILPLTICWCPMLLLLKMPALQLIMSRCCILCRLQ
jgi:hypothetical protein